MKPTRVMAVAILIVGNGLALQVARAQETRNPIPPAPTIAGLMAGIKRTDLQRHALGQKIEAIEGIVPARHSLVGRRAATGLMQQRIADLAISVIGLLRITLAKTGAA